MAGRQCYGRKRRSRIRAVQMDNFRGLLGIRRKDRVPNARIRELCGAKKGLDERIDEGVLPWFGHVKRMEKERRMVQDRSEWRGFVRGSE